MANKRSSNKLQQSENLNKKYGTKNSLVDKSDSKEYNYNLTPKNFYD